MMQSLLANASRRVAVRALHTSTPALAATVRSAAPAFECEVLKADSTIGKMSLSELKGKWVVLFWYPLDFTFVCPTEITAFSDRVGEFKAVGCEVVGASIDSAFSHLAWVNTPRKQGGLGKMNIPLLADVTKKVSRAYGALVETPGDDLEGVTLRATYIIDPSGIVRHIGINDAPVGRSVDEVLRLVKAFQFVEKHGEVCPAGWTEGKKTMIADPIKAQKYFNELK